MKKIYVLVALASFSNFASDKPERDGIKLIEDRPNRSPGLHRPSPVRMLSANSPAFVPSSVNTSDLIVRSVTLVLSLGGTPFDSKAYTGESVVFGSPNAIIKKPVRINQVLSISAAPSEVTSQASSTTQLPISSSQEVNDKEIDLKEIFAVTQSKFSKEECERNQKIYQEVKNRACVEGSINRQLLHIMNQNWSGLKKEEEYFIKHARLKSRADSDGKNALIELRQKMKESLKESCDRAVAANDDLAIGNLLSVLAEYINYIRRY